MLKKVKGIKSKCEDRPLPLTINEETADKAVNGMDVVIDGLDRFGPRRAINRACIKHDIPYIYGGALETYGNVSTIIPRKTACLECFTGTGFTTPKGGEPDHIYLVGKLFIVGTITGGATATSFTANFPPTPDPSVYLIIVGFNEGSEASISFSIT